MPAFYNLRVQRLLISFLLVTTFAAAKSPRDRAIQEVAQAERDFAKMSVAEGTRPAFFANFAEDGLSFGPKPTRMRELFGPPPNPSVPRKNVLDWHPIWTDASHSGDFAFSTGPSVTSERATGKAIRWGNFVSVWRKQADGKWKVIMDIGAQHAEPPPSLDTPWRAGKESKFKGKNGNVGDEAEALKLFERQFANNEQMTVAYSPVLTDESRLHRQGIFPVLGKSAILEHFEKSGESSVTFAPIGAGVAWSGDLAYTYGAYTSQPGDKKGYYSHFWKREKNGEWKLIIDVTNPEDSEY